MIFITLGTQDKSFKRLLEAVQKQIDLGKINDKVIVQAGYTKFKSDDMEIFDLVSMDDFNRYMEECDLLITHGGVGSIIDGLKHDKKIIAMPRLKKYNEHTNDHQLQIIETYYNNGYILKLDENDDLGKVLDQLSKFKPKKHVSDNKKIIENIKKFIDCN